MGVASNPVVLNVPNQLVYVKQGSDVALVSGGEVYTLKGNKSQFDKLAGQNVPFTAAQGFNPRRKAAKLATSRVPRPAPGL